MSAILRALQNVQEIIEHTYAYDENGERIDEPGEASAADIVEMLCGIEGVVEDAIEEAKELQPLNAKTPEASSELLSTLRECLTDEDSVAMSDESRNAAFHARERLHRINWLIKTAIRKASTPTPDKTESR